MLLRGRYSHKGFLEVEGERVAFLDLSDLLHRPESGFEIDFAVPAKSPDPYDGFLDKLIVRVNTDQQTTIRRDDRAMVVEGPADQLIILADNVRFLAVDDSKPTAVRKHTHIEYFEDHPYLSGTSVPLVLALLEP